MKRREFISLSLLSVLAIQAPRSKAETSSLSINTESFVIGDVVVYLQKLPLESLVARGEWDLSQIFNHTAQSIEYSITGYPEHKSEFFKQSIGPLAFQAFTLWGKMTHGLAEGIPGAPAISALANQQQALNRLIKALTQFDLFQGVLQPHFAYGLLNKAEYALAHALHLNNHLEEVHFVQTA
jgi:hypothetical protein